MRKHFFCSDFHESHGNILKYSRRTKFMTAQELAADPDDRQFRISRESVERMNDALVQGINDRVGEDDILWCLGDWCFGPDNQYLNIARAFRNRINCRTIHFIWGNHDDRRIAENFTTCHDLVMVAIDPVTGQYWLGDEAIQADRKSKSAQKIVLCHYAMAVWNGSHKGNWCFHGHSHGGAEPWLDRHMPGRRSIDVGVDNAYKLLGDYVPFSFDEIKAIMEKKTGFSMDHHVAR